MGLLTKGNSSVIIQAIVDRESVAPRHFVIYINLLMWDDKRTVMIVFEN